MAVSKVKAIRTICKRVTATPYKKKITLFKINYDTKYKKIHMYVYMFRNARNMANKGRFKTSKSPLRAKKLCDRGLT